MSQSLPAGPYQDLDKDPIYNIGAVVEATGVSAATLRAWERRYKALTPGRTDGGYRLYSVRDIALLRWLKARVDEGVSISQAISLLTHRRPIPSGLPVEPRSEELRPGAHEAREVLLQALLRYDEPRADRTVEEAFAVYGMERVVENILAPVMIRIGDMWHEGKASTAAEHFSSTYLRRKLDAIINAAPQVHSGPRVVLGCGPGDWHEMGLLLIHLMLRRRNINAIYLGQNVPLQEFVEEMQRLGPAIIVMSATTAETADGLIEMAAAVQDMPAPHPLFGFGGRIFNVEPELRAKVLGVFLGENARSAVEHILTLISDAAMMEAGPLLRLHGAGGTETSGKA